VEEVDSDDTDTQGVGLISRNKSFQSDSLQFTGIDMSSRSRSRRAYDYDTEESTGDSEDSDGASSVLQLAYKDKEEALVRSALARIRRAQEKGKTEVKLNQEELDALQRQRRRLQASGQSTPTNSRKSSGTEKERRRSEQVRVSVPLAAIEGNGKKSSKRRSEQYDIHPPSAANPPGMLVAGPDGLAYAPVGYLPPKKASSNRGSPSRPRSSTLQQRGTPPPQYAYPQLPRQFSDHARPNSSSSSSSRRPMPDDIDWIPADSRRSSVSSQTHRHIDPFEYQVAQESPPLPAQYMIQQNSGRRYFSGPADVQYSSVRRNPAMASSSYLPQTRSSSDPRMRRRGYEDVYAEDSSEGDQSDDLGNGVQVFVEEEPEREKEREKPKQAVSRKPVASGSVGRSSGRKRGKK
jgi:hypothetical protein